MYNLLSLLTPCYLKVSDLLRYYAVQISILGTKVAAFILCVVQELCMIMFLKVTVFYSPPTLPTPKTLIAVAEPKSSET